MEQRNLLETDDDVHSNSEAGSSSGAAYTTGPASMAFLRSHRRALAIGSAVLLALFGVVVGSSASWAWGSSRPALAALRRAPLQAHFQELDERGTKEFIPDADMMWQSDAMKKAMEQKESLAASAQKLADEMRERDMNSEEKGEESTKASRSEAASNLLLGALDTLMANIPTKRADGFVIIESGRCSDSSLQSIKFMGSCERAGKKLTLRKLTSHSSGNLTLKVEGCYTLKGQLIIDDGAQGKVSLDSGVHEICMDEARSQKERDWLATEAEVLQQEAEEQRKKHLLEEERLVKQWEKDELTAPNVSLYCFALMMPFGYEPGLLKEQEHQKVGIYACDEHTVFSNQTILMSGEESPVEISMVPGSLAVAYGGRWMTALNTGVFNRLWMEVIKLGRYRYHDWIVKVDPDAVFFPSRLRELLRHKSPYHDPEVQRRVPEPKSMKCGTCGLKGHDAESCASHVRKWQSEGHTCKKSLELAARPPPHDCGCECDDFACDLPGSAVYLNNCKWGLHGPIEVLSRRAVATYAAGLPKCVDLLQNPWGEDKFLDQCMQQLGVTRSNEYSLLSETACGEQPAPCGTSNVAFHPFKSIQSYFMCWQYANKYGQGPAAPPTFADLADSEVSDLIDVTPREDVHVV
mmetsp:Transcript_78534/g.163164  ORF Transcript_78534/g.163164 Transcript_78534/m.163164 type:complete len:635 (-) Transcript_78534:203-2107(-)